jgi:outer membrane protein TolC
VVSAESQRLVAVNLLDRAQIDLARALGLDPATRFALADTLSGSFGALGVPSDPEAAVTAALGGRPELRAESLKQRRARSDRLAIRAERLPRIEAAADYGLSGADGPDAIATRQFSVALTLPLIDGFRREARLAEQGAVIREAEVRERDLRDEIAAEVKAALLDLASGLDQQNVAAERITLAQEEVAQATDRFRNGVTGNIEVIDAQSSLVRARDAQIDARAATAVARIELARAAGQARTLR